MFAVIVENDVSQWSDETGVLYHFPKRYEPLLRSGTRVVYYKGRSRDRMHLKDRLTPEAHYFGVARVGKIYLDKTSSKGDLFATIEDFFPFQNPVPIKASTGEYFETIPANRTTNYWRDGVRGIDGQTFERIIKLAELVQPSTELQTPKEDREDENEPLVSWLEGSRTMKYVTTYERDRRYRMQAIAIHGHRCVVCDQSMEDLYGEVGRDLVHIHHVVPVSTYEQPKSINPESDLVPVCPNCHAIIHRRRSSTLTIAEARRHFRRHLTDSHPKVQNE